MKITTFFFYWSPVGEFLFFLTIFRSVSIRETAIENCLGVCIVYFSVIVFIVF